MKGQIYETVPPPDNSNVKEVKMTRLSTKYTLMRSHIFILHFIIILHSHITVVIFNFWGEKKIIISKLTENFHVLLIKLQTYSFFIELSWQPC